MNAFVSNVSVPLHNANSFTNGACPLDATKRLSIHHDTSSSSPSSPPPPAVTMGDGDSGKGKKFSLPSIKLPVKLPKVSLPFGNKNPAPEPPTRRAPAVIRPNVAVKVSVPRVPAGTPAAPRAPQANKALEKRAMSLGKDVRTMPKQYQFLEDSKIINKTCYDMRIIAPSYFYTRDKQGSKNQTFNDMDVYTDDSFWEYPGGWPREQALIAIDRCLKQLFGTSKLFKSDMKQLTTSIMCVKQTGNLKEFMREVALSSLYRQRFFEPVSNIRFIEVNFKHFLGRAPRDQQELSEHVALITRKGYEAEINSYFDSEEYDTLYGYTRIPSINFDSRFPFNQSMNKTALLNGAFVTPDNLSQASKGYFIDGGYAAFPPFSIAKGLPSGWKSGKNVVASTESEGVSQASLLDEGPPADFGSDQLAYKMRYGVIGNYWYKDSIIYKMNEAKMEPVLTHSKEEEEEAAAILKYGSTMAKMYVTQN